MFGARSPLDRGLDAFGKKRWKPARAAFDEAALDGDRNAAYHLGLLHWRGLGGPVDRQVAVYWFRRAAEEELPAAQDALAVALRNGWGAEKNIEEARRLFTAAAQRGFAPAMSNLASLCEPGDARRWLTRAAEAGHTPAMRALCDMIEDKEPIEALGWLYAAVALSGDEACVRRAKQLARSVPAAGIAEAQKRGRTLARKAELARRALT